MDINLETKVGGLIDAYPELIDFLIELSPKYSRLKNPVLRATVAKYASLKHAAEMGGFPPIEFVNRIRERLGFPPLT